MLTATYVAATIRASNCLPTAVHNRHPLCCYFDSCVSYRLGGQYQLDLVQFHWWEYDTGSYVDAAKHLHSLQREGLIRHLGVTNFSAQKVAELIGAGVPISVAQVWRC